MNYRIIFLLIFICAIFLIPIDVLAECLKGETCLEDPLGLPADKPIPTLIGKVIKGALGIVGSLALVMFIYGGLVWMTSAGNEQRVKTGKDILIWATIGLVIIFTSYALVHFIIFKGLGLPEGG